ncbi:MAG: DEAD/DEAH box helicase, partial [Pseudomonadota bacterium]
MATRPEILFPLFSDLTTLPGIGPKTAQNLAALRVEKPRDLLFHLPHAVIDRRPVASVQGQELPATLTVEVQITRHRAPSRKGAPHRIFVEDAETAFQVVYFNASGRFLENLLPVGERRVLSGKVELFDGEANMVHPDYVAKPSEISDIPVYEAVYPLTAGVTQKALAKGAAAALTRVPELPEWADAALVTREGWPSTGAAIHAVHAPETLADVSPSAKARQRLAYDELFAHQLTLALARAQDRKSRGIANQADGHLRQRILRALPFAPTAAQTRAIAEIAAEMAEPKRMNRLLQGDVGAGKTLVAFLALLIAVEAGGQGVMMAPTEILARQHLESLAPLAAQAGVRLELLTGRDKGAERAEKLAALADGRIAILVGTHAVFQDDVSFRDLRLAIVDEQHRFGVRQRMLLGEKGAAADVLVMTATPIPRSLALAQYGDMEVSVLDEKPPGRQPIQTATVPMARLDD